MKRLLSISILLLFAYSGYCQMASRNGYYLAPYDTLKVLIVFAEIDYSGDTLFSEPDTYPDAWDAGALPDWKDDLLDPTWSGSPQAKLTKYYYEASFGKLIVLGDYLVPDTGQIAEKQIINL